MRRRRRRRSNFGFDTGTKFVDGALGYQATLMNDAYVTAKALDDFENMRMRKMVAPWEIMRCSMAFRVREAMRVHAFEGFIEEENWAVNYGGGHG